MKIGGRTVLIVDRERVVLRCVAATLRHFGFVVLTAESVREVFALCNHPIGDIDLALLDAPDMSGPDARDCLQRAFPGIRILRLSAYSSGLALANDGWLYKPFSAPQLVQRVRAALSRPQPDYDLVTPLRP